MDFQGNSMLKDNLVYKDSSNLIFFRGKASTHLVKQSTIISRYLFPEEVVGRESKISICTLSKGVSIL